SIPYNFLRLLYFSFQIPSFFILIFYFFNRIMYYVLEPELSSDVCSSDLLKGTNSLNIDSIINVLTAVAILVPVVYFVVMLTSSRSEERRVGKEFKCGLIQYHHI